MRDLLPKETAGYRHWLEAHREGEDIKPTGEKWLNVILGKRKAKGCRDSHRTQPSDKLAGLAYLCAPSFLIEPW